MHIRVSTLTGNSAGFEVNSSQNVQDLMKLIEESLNIPSIDQKLIFNGKRLESGLLEEFGIVNESNIYLVVSLDGGKGKKKKKKVKKNKKPHKKRKVKLAVLSYFKVDGGKVVRLRQRSPAGTFMAEHTDRYYCGRSHITYKKKEDTTTQKVEKAEKVVAKPEAKVEETKKKGKK